MLASRTRRISSSVAGERDSCGSALSASSWRAFESHPSASAEAGFGGGGVPVAEALQGCRAGVLATRFLEEGMIPSGTGPTFSLCSPEPARTDETDLGRYRLSSCIGVGG